MVRFFIWVVVGAAVVVTGLWLFQRRLIYLPTQRIPSIGDVAAGWREAAYQTSDGPTLRGWFVPPRDGKSVVVVFNGNAGNRSDRMPLGNGLATHGFGVLLVDYRGYGGNPGHPTESGLADDARAAVRWLRESEPDHLVVYFGESLGAAVAIELAVAEPPSALVLRSPFTSLSAVGAVHYPFLPVRLMLWDRFPSLDRIQEVTAPTLVIAGTSDSIVPIGQSRAIYEAASQPKTWMVVDGADHNDPRLTSGAELIEATTRFLGDVIP